LEPTTRAEELVSDGVVTVKEAAAFLGLAVSTIYKLMDQGDLEYAKIGRSRRIPRRALSELVTRNLVPQANG
jgi:excisionase family DNA binding protein